MVLNKTLDEIVGLSWRKMVSGLKKVDQALATIEFEETSNVKNIVFSFFSWYDKKVCNLCIPSMKCSRQIILMLANEKNDMH